MRPITCGPSMVSSIATGPAQAMVSVPRSSPRGVVRPARPGPTSDFPFGHQLRRAGVQAAQHRARRAAASARPARGGRSPAGRGACIQPWCPPRILLPPICSPGMPARNAACPGAARPTLTASGSPRSCCNRRRWRRWGRAFHDSWRASPTWRRWRRRNGMRWRRNGRAWATTPGRATCMPQRARWRRLGRLSARRGGAAGAAGHRRLHRGRRCRHCLWRAGGAGRRQCRAGDVAGSSRWRHRCRRPKPRLAGLAQGFMAQPAARAAPGDFAQALFDLGATICTPRRPACALCPWLAGCAARAAGIQAEPCRARRRKKPRGVLHGVHFLLRDAHGRAGARRRPGGGPVRRHAGTARHPVARPALERRGGHAPCAGVTRGELARCRGRGAHAHPPRTGAAGVLRRGAGIASPAWPR